MSLDSYSVTSNACHCHPGRRSDPLAAKPIRDPAHAAPKAHIGLRATNSLGPGARKWARPGDSMSELASAHTF
jgi:hypothetical protein